MPPAAGAFFGESYSDRAGMQFGVNGVSNGRLFIDSMLPAPAMPNSIVHPMIALVAVVDLVAPVAVV